MSGRSVGSSHLLPVLLVLIGLVALLSATSAQAESTYASGPTAPKPPKKAASTPTATATFTATATSTPSATATATVVPSATSTATQVVPTATSTATSTATPTDTVVATVTPTDTAVATATGTSAPTATPTSTVSEPAIGTSTATATPGGSATPTPTATPGGSATATATGTTMGTATPTVTPGGPPLNDDFDSAVVIGSFPFTTGLDTTRATVASDDPDMGAGAGKNTHTVWYRFGAPASGSVRADTFGSSYDTVLAAFTGPRGGLARLAANDDAPGSLQSEIRFNVQAGTTYHLEVAQYEGQGNGGQMRLAVQFSNEPVPAPTDTPVPTNTPEPTNTPIPTATLTPPSNDDFGSAREIGGFPFSAEQEIGGATVASDDPNMGAGSGQNSNTVWYRFVAPSHGSVRIDTYGSEYDTVLAVFTGSRGDLTLVASNDDGSPSTLQSGVHFNVSAGTTYHVEIAQYGYPGTGKLRLSAEFSSSPVGSPTATATVTGTPVAEVIGLRGTPGPLASPSTAVAGPGEVPATAVPADARYFRETGFRVNRDAFWDYFQRRGGVRTFGYPISREFRLMGLEVQFFQRGVLQLMPDGSVTTMKLAEDALFPYTRINFSTVPAPERDLIDGAPSVGDPDYAEKAIAFVRANVPDRWEGMPVGFLEGFMGTVRFRDAFPEGRGEPALIPLMNLELWGLPTSRPAYDPSNHGFVYQRFQGGIMHYDASTGITQGLLLGDYLKSIMTGQGLPLDLASDAANSRFYRQYERDRPGFVGGRNLLPGSDLTRAFDREAVVELPATEPISTP